MMRVVAKIPAWLAEESEQPALVQTPTWYQEHREQQWQAFCREGLPTKSSERFKYADLTFLHDDRFSNATPSRFTQEDIQSAINSYRLKTQHILFVFIDGHFAPSFSDLSLVPSDMKIYSLQEALSKEAGLVKSFYTAPLDTAVYPFASLNIAKSNAGLFVYLPPHCQLPIPIHMLSLATADNCLSYPQRLILLSDAAQLEWIEEYVALSDLTYLSNSLTRIHLGKEASLKCTKIQNESRKAIHLAHTFVNQSQESDSFFTQIAAGALFGREELSIHLNERGAQCKTGGFYCLNADGQYLDHHIDIAHQAPFSYSEMLYKGTLDKQSSAVFNGRLHVGNKAKQIKAYQTNHHLLLADNAMAYSKPELEIYADDVICKHGATTGQLDQAALFYLRARGISEEEAINMILRGFSDEILKRISQPDIIRRIQKMVAT